LAIVLSSSFRSHFELARHDHRVLTAFWLPDLAVFVTGSLVSAVAIRRGSQWAFAATALTAGVSAYATLYLAAWVAAGGTGWGGLVVMGAATAATASIAWHLRRTDQ
jgi:hypothetical protein